MGIVEINGLSIAYETVGDPGTPWIVTPGGRFSKDYRRVRELAAALAGHGNRVVIWDRPNTGVSDVCFSEVDESTMHADGFAGLVAHLDLAPAVIAGGSGGARVSLLTAAHHPHVAAAVALWWISGASTA
jgi:pimeloyl-ACP methyl ester carboxylesterase